MIQISEVSLGPDRDGHSEYLRSIFHNIKSKKIVQNDIIIINEHFVIVFKNKNILIFLSNTTILKQKFVKYLADSFHIKFFKYHNAKSSLRFFFSTFTFVNDHVITD